MKISKNAWHAKLYGYIYGFYYVKHATNLCPYFWGTILAVIVLPFVFSAKQLARINPPSVDVPHVDFDIPRIEFEVPEISRKTQITIGKIALISVISLVSLGLYQLGDMVGWDNFLYGTLVVVGVITTIVGIIYSLIKVHDRWCNWRHDHPKKYKEPKPNMLWVMIKAKKNEHCPMLEWEE